MASISQIPTGPHYAILTESSITIPGDERSRTNPGHGYPEHSVSYINYEAFTDEAKWKERIEYLTFSAYGKQNFRAIMVHPAAIKTTVQVETKFEDFPRPEPKPKRY